MESMKLPNSPVVFENEHHTYTLNGYQLQGVTPIISWLFPKTYAGISKQVLDAAADYGTRVHEKCELCDSLGIADDEITMQYQRIIKDAGLTTAYSEYLVSDEQYIASCIDKVFTDDSLGDIKTTSKIHRINVQVQLSIYAWLYEMQTGRKANKLYVIWLPKPQYAEPCVSEVERISKEWCESCVKRYLAGDTPDESVAELESMGYITEPKGKGEIPEDMLPYVDELMLVKKQMESLEKREKELKGVIMKLMQMSGDTTLGNDLITLSMRGESERKTIDSKALKATYPDIYEKYIKVTKVAPSLTYKVL